MHGLRKRWQASDCAWPVRSRAFLLVNNLYFDHSQTCSVNPSKNFNGSRKMTLYISMLKV